MNTLVAYIDEKNFDLLAEAKQNSGRDYKKGPKMTFSENDEEKEIFHPIFCNSIGDGAELIKEYTAIKAKSSTLGKDFILHGVLIKILGF